MQLDVTYLAISDIRVEGNHRPLRPIDSLMESIKEHGLLHPITVTSDFRLVAGQHRLEAVKALGWTHVPVVIRDLDTSEEEILRIDENLIRAEMTALEKAVAFARRRELYDAIRTRNWQEGTPSFTAKTAEDLGLDQRSVQRYLQVATIEPQVRDTLAPTPFADNLNELVALARVDTPRQAETVSYAMEHSLSLREAIRALSTKSDGQPKWDVVFYADEPEHHDSYPLSEQGVIISLATADSVAETLRSHACPSARVTAILTRDSSRNEDSLTLVVVSAKPAGDLPILPEIMRCIEFDTPFHLVIEELDRWLGENHPSATKLLVGGEYPGWSSPAAALSAAC